MSIKIETKRNNPLIKAYFDGNIRKFRSLIKSGENINCLYNRKNSLIGLILKSQGRPKTNLMFFDEMMANNVHLGNIGDTPGVLFLAIFYQTNDYYFKKLLDNGANVNEFGICSEHAYGPPIHDLIFNEKGHLLKSLLKKSPDLDICDKGNEPLLNSFIEHNMYLDAYPNRQRKGQEKYINEIFPLFIKKGIDPTLRGNDGKQAIHLLAENCYDKNIFKNLFKSNYKIDINSRDCFGNTPLIIAAYEDNQAALEFLIEKGADLNIVNSKGHNALMNTIYNLNENMLIILIKNNVNLKLTDKNGNNIIHYIFKHSYIMDYYVTDDDTMEDYLKMILKKEPSLFYQKNKKNQNMIDLLKKYHTDKSLLKEEINKYTKIYQKYTKELER